MEFTGSHEFKAGRKKVYAAFFNADILKEAISGCKQARWGDPNTLELVVDVNFLVIKGSYTGYIHASEQQEPSHFKLSLSRASIQASASIDLVEKGANTDVSYKAEITLAGALKAADNPIGKQAAKKMLDNFFEAVEKQIV
jgi:carbon monoxide dehydrogenase subunit G